MASLNPDHWYVAINQSKLNMLERALNKFLGGQNFLPVVSQDVDGDGNIDNVVVDTSSMNQQADDQNNPQSKWFVDVTLLKWYLDGRGNALNAKIQARMEGGVDPKQWIINNRFRGDDPVKAIVYEPPAT